MYRLRLRRADNYSMGEESFHASLTDALEKARTGIDDPMYGTIEIHEVCPTCRKGEELVLQAGAMNPKELHESLGAIFGE